MIVFYTRLFINAAGQNLTFIVLFFKNILCANGLFGADCSLYCGKCKIGTVCNNLTGKCSFWCQDDWQGLKCDGMYYTMN